MHAGAEQGERPRRSIVGRRRDPADFVRAERRCSTSFVPAIVACELARVGEVTRSGHTPDLNTRSPPSAGSGDRRAVGCKSPSRRGRQRMMLVGQSGIWQRGQCGEQPRARSVLRYACPKLSRCRGAPVRRPRWGRRARTLAPGIAHARKGDGLHEGADGLRICRDELLLRCHLPHAVHDPGLRRHDKPRSRPFRNLADHPLSRGNVETFGSTSPRPCCR